MMKRGGGKILSLSFSFSLSPLLLFSLLSFTSVQTHALSAFNIS